MPTACGSSTPWTAPASSPCRAEPTGLCTSRCGSASEPRGRRHFTPAGRAAACPPPRADGPIRITASASRPPAVLWRLRDRMDIQMVRIGSAGAKAMAVVRGDVDAYVHAGGQWGWGSGAPAGGVAPAGVVQPAGLHASRRDGSPLIYNRRDPYLPDLLMCRAELAGVLLDGILSA